MEAMRHLDLTLPTEAQWEYAARAGTTTPWWSGAAPSDLRGAGNLSEGEGGTGWPKDEDIVDGWQRLAPIGSYRANRFGLFDTIGNVWEWCRDAGSYPHAIDPSTGQRVGFDPRIRTTRGGSFESMPARARVSKRDHLIIDNADPDLGLRPAREVER
jgi:formylglycine-generating enzyme required for sulfatase activity